MASLVNNSKPTESSNICCSQKICLDYLTVEKTSDTAYFIFQNHFPIFSQNGDIILQVSKKPIPLTTSNELQDRILAEKIAEIASKIYEMPYIPDNQVVVSSVSISPGSFFLLQIKKGEILGQLDKQTTDYELSEKDAREFAEENGYLFIKAK